MLSNNNQRQQKGRQKSDAPAENRTRGPTMATLDFTTKPLALGQLVPRRPATALYDHRPCIPQNMPTANRNHHNDLLAFLPRQLMSKFHFLTYGPSPQHTDLRLRLDRCGLKNLNPERTLGRERGRGGTVGPEM